MGSCASNKNDIIELRINDPNSKIPENFRRNKTKKHKSLPLVYDKHNKCPNFKMSKKSVPTLNLNELSGISIIENIPDYEDIASMNNNTNNTFKKIIEVINIQ